LFDRAAGFLLPRPQISHADARRSCQGRPSFRHRGTLRRFQAAPWQLRARRQTGWSRAGRALGVELVPLLSLALDWCRCQIHRSLRGPGSLAAPWPQGFDAAMSRTHL